MIYLHAQRRHGKARAMQRYGIELNKQLRRDITRLIYDGKGLFIQKCKSKRVVLMVIFENQECLVIYDKKTKTIVTFLPKGDPRWSLVEAKRPKKELTKEN